MDRKILAHDLFKSGYNCAQAVLLAFEDVLPVDHDNLMMFSSSFGGGFAKTRNICGAVSAMGMVVGLLSDKKGNPEQIKTQVYKSVRLLTDEFVKRNSSLQCGELLRDIKEITKDYKPTERTAEYYKTRPCSKFVMDAVELIMTSEEYKNIVIN